jgi:hypothetical protein
MKAKWHDHSIHSCSGRSKCFLSSLSEASYRGLSGSTSASSIRTFLSLSKCDAERMSDLK